MLSVQLNVIMLDTFARLCVCMCVWGAVTTYDIKLTILVI